LLKELCLGRTPLFYGNNNLPKNLKENYGGIRVPDNDCITNCEVARNPIVSTSR
jgi:hypothetical protein